VPVGALIILKQGDILFSARFATLAQIGLRCGETQTNGLIFSRSSCSMMKPAHVSVA
jgi:hypothetical protein